MQISIVMRIRRAAWRCVGSAAAVALLLAGGPAQGESIKPKLFLLAVGVSAYEQPDLRLTFAAKDARDFAAVLQLQKGMLYRSVEAKVLTDEQATKDQILDGLDWLQKETTSKDVAMLFLAGHGVTDQNGVYYFLPVNAELDKIKRTGVMFTDVRNTIGAIAGKTLAFLDTCHAGDLMGARRGVADITTVVNELASAESGAVVFAACTGAQLSQSKPEWGNGAFTKALVEGFGGKADLMGDGKITVNMLDLYLSERVRELTQGRQSPTTTKPQTIQDFPIALRDIASSRTEPVSSDSGPTLPAARGVPRERSVVRPGLPSQPAPRNRMMPRWETSDENGKSLYRVWYGTTRKPMLQDNRVVGYDVRRDDGQVHYGMCYVEVPESHEFGSVGGTWWSWKKMAFMDDRLQVSRIETLSAQDFVRRLQETLSSHPTGERVALVYIHGFNNTFEEAAIRAAQIGFDLKVQGIMAFFSWPSKGGLADYAADKESVAGSERALKDFLINIVRQSGAEEVHLIAHSMGNQGLIRAMEAIYRDPQLKDIRFGHIILAAPDIDVQVFKDLAQVYPQVSRKTTMYVSSKDRALQASAIYQDFPRAGFYPPITILPPIDTISVTDVDLTVLGHGYISAAEAVLNDMALLLSTNLEPIKRVRVKPQMTETGDAYWLIGR